MKLYSIWQPLDTEDDRTALVFAFLRHAPIQPGLSAWLSEVLGKNVNASQLEPQDFWPQYTSHMPKHRHTVPELAFEANDGEPLHIIVESKPGYGMHETDQLVREVVDAAHEAPAARIALIAIGADLGVSEAQCAEWQLAVDAGLRAHGPPGTVATVHYSSWAQLGKYVRACGEADQAFQRYSADVLTQLRSKALLGYDGAPALEGLDEKLNVVNAFEVVNRSASAARQFFLLLHEQPSFASLRLGAYWRRNGKFEMRRTGTSTALTQDEYWFHTSMFMSAYRPADVADGYGAYVAFYFADGSDEPKLQAGAFHTTGNELLAEYDWSEDVERFQETCLSNLETEDLPRKAAGPNSEWRYDERPWLLGESEADVAWTIKRLRSAADLLRSAPRARQDTRT